MTLPLELRIEKNKIATDSAWIALLEIQLPTPIYICHNNEDITWNGQLWQAFPFQIGDITDDGKETPNLTIKVSNITREVGAVISAAKGGGGTSVILRVVNSNYLDQPAAIEEIFQASKTNIDNWVTITLSIPMDLIQRFPMSTDMKNFCRYLSLSNSGYCGIDCGLTDAIKATYPTCNGTLSNCRQRGNSKRYGGEPGLD
jgi:phage-related protein